MCNSSRRVWRVVITTVEGRSRRKGRELVVSHLMNSTTFNGRADFLQEKTQKGQKPLFLLPLAEFQVHLFRWGNKAFWPVYSSSQRPAILGSSPLFKWGKEIPARVISPTFFHSFLAVLRLGIKYHPLTSRLDDDVRYRVN